MAEETHRPKRGRRTWILRGIAVLLLALGALSFLGAWTAEFSSAAYERGSDGDLRRVTGGRGAPLGVFYNLVQGDFETDEIYFDKGQPERPFSRSSVSIVDISGTEVSRRLAHALTDDLRRLPYIDWVDVRIAGETLEVQRIGDLILVIEEFKAERSWLTTWSTHHRVHMGSVPEYGTGEPLTEAGPRSIFWEVKSEQRFFGSPMRSAEAIANMIANSMDLPKALDEAAKKHVPALAVPPMLLPAAFEGPGETAVATATGLNTPPVLRGVRAGVRGEVLWRYEGNDAVLRLHQAIDELEGQGWTRHPHTSRSPEGEFHRGAATRGTEVVEWIYETARKSILQDVWWSGTRLPDGSWSTPVHHASGPGLPPVLWVHYRNEMGPEQLRSAWSAAQAEGTHTAEAFVSNLSRSQRALLEIPEPTGTQ